MHSGDLSFNQGFLCLEGSTWSGLCTSLGFCSWHSIPGIHHHWPPSWSLNTMAILILGVFDHKVSCSCVSPSDFHVSETSSFFHFPISGIYHIHYLNYLNIVSSSLFKVAKPWLLINIMSSNYCSWSTNHSLKLLIYCLMYN